MTLGGLPRPSGLILPGGIVTPHPPVVPVILRQSGTDNAGGNFTMPLTPLAGSVVIVCAARNTNAIGTSACTGLGATWTRFQTAVFTASGNTAVAWWMGVVGPTPNATASGITVNGTAVSNMLWAEFTGLTGIVRATNRIQGTGGSQVRWTPLVISHALSGGVVLTAAAVNTSQPVHGMTGAIEIASLSAGSTQSRLFYWPRQYEANEKVVATWTPVGAGGGCMTAIIA